MEMEERSALTAGGGALLDAEAVLALKLCLHSLFSVTGFRSLRLYRSAATIRSWAITAASSLAFITVAGSESVYM